MKTLTKVIIAVGCMCIVDEINARTLKAGEVNEDGEKKLAFNEYGYQLNNDDWIMRVERDRQFDELTIFHPVSTQKYRTHVLDENGKEIEPLFPFQYATIRKLIIDNSDNGISAKIGQNAFETVAFTGIKDLEEIVFKGKIIEFKEESKWLGLRKDSDWRKNLKRIVFEDELGFEKVPFLYDVKCIVLGTNTCADLVKISRDRNDGIWKALTSCHKLEKLVVPYELACNTNISWRAIIERTGLKGKEVVSQSSGLHGDDDTGDRILLNIASSGEISDVVTEIRADAIEKFDGRHIFLPVSLKTIVGTPSKAQSCKFALKKNSVLFYPAIDVLQERRKLERSRSFFSRSSVALASAYSNAVVYVNKKRQVNRGGMRKKGSAYVTGFYLERDDNKKSCIELGLDVAGIVYPVGFFDSNDSLQRKPISVSFVYQSYGVGVIVSTIIGWLLLSAFLVLVYIRCGRKSGVEKFGMSSCLITAGLFMVFFGNGYANLLQCVVDRWLTEDVMSYLNASFVSSLVISVTTTLVKFVVGFLQSVSFSAIVVDFDLNSLLAPVQDILDKISTYSWISTGVLAFIRIFCQLIRDAAHIIWPVLGVSVVVSTMMGIFKSSNCARNIRRWIGIVSVFCGFLAIGLPLVLWCCANVSAVFADITGSAFENAMRSFGELAESFSVSSLTSMNKVKVLLMLFTEAVAELTSASMYYVANKAFDCFIVPLGLYMLAKKAFKGIGDKKDMELSRIRELMECGGGVGSRISCAEPVPAIDIARADDNITHSCKVEGENISGASFIKRKLPMNVQNNKVYRWLSAVRPEWVTATCAVLLCAMVSIGTLTSENAVVVFSGDNVPEKVVAATEAPPPAVPSNSGGGIFSWIVGMVFISGFVVINYYLYKRAIREKDLVANDRTFETVQSRLEMLKEKSFWFDLPLYLGLLGTVMGFLIISFLESLAQVGRVVSYCSTIIGIFVSVGIHAKIASFRAKLLRERGAKDE